jgi:predicted N-formylglutamate amidohydrolase
MFCSSLWRRLMLAVQELLTQEEGSPVAVEGLGSQGPFVLVCEHASNRLPDRFGNLGLDEEALESHIAWDPGALAVARLMAKNLNSVLIFQRFSRLVYDCNRPPEAKDAMPSKSEIYTIPGNENLSQAERDLRTNALYVPFKKQIDEVLAERRRKGQQSILLTVHSFTPVYRGKHRAVEIGILHDQDTRLADSMLQKAMSNGLYVVQRNEPYGPKDGVTHTLKEHGLANGLLNVMIEVRNDLIQEESSQGVMADFLTGLLLEGMTSLSS